MSVKIIVDSTADLLPEQKARVQVVPLTVHFADKEYIGSVIGTHAGPGAVAVAFFKK